MANNQNFVIFLMIQCFVTTTSIAVAINKSVAAEPRYGTTDGLKHYYFNTVPNEPVFPGMKGEFKYKVYNLSEYKTPVGIAAEVDIVQQSNNLLFFLDNQDYSRLINKINTDPFIRRKYFIQNKNDYSWNGCNYSLVFNNHKYGDFYPPKACLISYLTSKSHETIMSYELCHSPEYGQRNHPLNIEHRFIPQHNLLIPIGSYMIKFDSKAANSFNDQDVVYTYEDVTTKIDKELLPNPAYTQLLPYRERKLVNSEGKKYLPIGINSYAIFYIPLYPNLERDHYVYEHNLIKGTNTA